MVQRRTQQGVFATDMGNGITVYDFDVQETSNMIKPKKQRKARETKKQKLKRQMVAAMVEQMSEYLLQKFQQPSVQAPARTQISVQDLLNAKDT